MSCPFPTIIVVTRTSHGRMFTERDLKWNTSVIVTWQHRYVHVEGWTWWSPFADDISKWILLNWYQQHHKNIKRHTVHIIVSWPKPKQWQKSHTSALRWRHNELDGVSDHQPHDCLLNRLFGRRSKKTSKLRVTGLCVGNLPGTGEFPAKMASNAENVSIWWRHHGFGDGNKIKYTYSHNHMREISSRDTHRPIYCMEDDWGNWRNFTKHTHTHSIYRTWRTF